MSDDRYDVQGGDEEEASKTREEEMKIEIDLLKGGRKNKGRYGSRTSHNH